MKSRTPSAAMILLTSLVVLAFQTVEVCLSEL
jgi:hypothetical protein